MLALWATYSKIDGNIYYYLLAVNLTVDPYNLVLSYLWPLASTNEYWVVDYTIGAYLQNGMSAEDLGLVKFSTDSPYAIPLQALGNGPYLPTFILTIVNFFFIKDYF